MALVKLCSMFNEYDFARRTYKLHIQAFIVDHKAREGSRWEAIQVKNSVMRMGIAPDSHVVPHY